MSGEVDYRKMFFTALTALQCASLGSVDIFLEFFSMVDSVDYKKMYHLAVNEIEDTIRTLIVAQKKCEEMYLQYTE